MTDEADLAELKMENLQCKNDTLKKQITSQRSKTDETQIKLDENNKLFEIQIKKHDYLDRQKIQVELNYNNSENKNKLLDDRLIEVSEELKQEKINHGITERKYIAINETFNDKLNKISKLTEDNERLEKDYEESENIKCRMEIDLEGFMEKSRDYKKELEDAMVKLTLAVKARQISDQM